MRPDIEEVFEKIKSDLSMKEVAAHYGLGLDRGEWLAALSTRIRHRA